MAVAALVFGLLAVVTFWLCGLGALAGIVAIVLGALGVQRANKEPDRPQRGVAIAGIVFGALGMVVSIAMIAVLFLFSDSSSISDMNSDPSDGVCNEDRYWQDPDC